MQNESSSISLQHDCRVLCFRWNACRTLRPEVRVSKSCYKPVKVLACISARPGCSQLSSAQQSTAGTPLGAAAATQAVQEELLQADPVFPSAKDVDSDKSFLGKPLICISTTLPSEVSMQHCCHCAACYIHLACHHDNLHEQAMHQSSQQGLPKSSCTCSVAMSIDVIGVLAVQTHYAAGVESLKAAVQKVAVRYRHYSSGVVRIEVCLSSNVSFVGCMSIANTQCT